MSRKAVYIFFLILYLLVGVGSAAYCYIHGDLNASSTLSEILNIYHSLF